MSTARSEFGTSPLTIVSAHAAVASCRSRSKAWRAWLFGEEARAAWRAIRRIANRVRATPTSYWRKSGVAEGPTGAALFLAYLAETLGDERMAADAEGLLARDLERIDSQRTNIGLLQGVLGISLAAEHLLGEPLHELDQVLPKHLDLDKIPAHDLIDGLVGIVLWGLESKSRLASDILENAVDRLIREGRWIDGEWTWWTEHRWLPSPVRAQFPDGYLNVGVAHGAVGTLTVLAQVVRTIAPRKPSLARQVLDCVERGWVTLERCFTVPEEWPIFVADGKRAVSPHVAWCYGALGGAAALNTAALALQGHDQASRLLAAVHAAAGRTIDAIELTPIDRWGLCTPGLCHGDAGGAHALARLAAHWPASALHGLARELMRRAVQAVDGPDAPRTCAPQGVDHGWLSGSSGVGLALLSAVTDVEPTWDRLLLISPTTMGELAPECSDALRGEGDTNAEEEREIE
jgi:lantibiotic biosynthesis protein